MTQKDFDGAYQLVGTTLERFPNNINAIAAHYVLVKLLNKDVDAIGPLNAYLMTGDTSSDDKILSATVMHEEGLLDEAITILETVPIDAFTSRKYWTTKSKNFIAKK